MVPSLPRTSITGVGYGTGTMWRFYIKSLTCSLTQKMLHRSERSEQGASEASNGASEASFEIQEPDSPTYFCVNALVAFINALLLPRRIRR